MKIIEDRNAKIIPANDKYQIIDTTTDKVHEDCSETEFETMADAVEYINKEA